MAEVIYPTIDHEQVNVFAFNEADVRITIPKMGSNRIAWTRLVNGIESDVLQRSVVDTVGLSAPVEFEDNGTVRKTLTGKEFTVSSKLLPYAPDFDVVSLFGELGWLMGKYSELSKHDDAFLKIADAMPDACSLIIDLLTRIEDDGYPVDWNACKPVQVVKVSWRDWLKLKVFGWLRKLVQGS